MFINKSITSSINKSINETITASASGGSMQDIEASTVFDVDATQASSYGGSGQTWANLVASPADGEGQTAYDLQLGNTGSPSTDDPTFTGSAGDSASYFLCDGGDNMSLVNSNANAPFFNKLHMGEAGQRWWIGFVLKTPTLATTNYALNANDGSSSNHGIFLRYFSSGNMQVFTAQGTSSDFASVSSVINSNTETLIILTYDRDTTTLDGYVNGVKVMNDTGFVNAADATDATHPYTFGGISSGTNKWDNGTRLYAFSGGNDYLDATRESAIRAEYEARHGRTY